MKKIILFNAEESSVLENILAELNSHSRTIELARIQILQTALEQLGGSISLYPPITGTDRLAGFSRNLDTLVESLCHRDQTEIAFNLPTKAILGKSYSMAKINFFYMLVHMTKEVPSLSGMDQQLLPLITRIVLTLMAEEVFMELIVDRGISIPIRHKAGYLLANLWEYRLDHGVQNFAPFLSSIWEARKSVAPVYGTLMGTSERFLLSVHLDNAWQDILDRVQLEESEQYAFDEFLFGLSYEDLLTIRRQMNAQGKSAVSENEIKTMLQKDRIYSGHPGSTPREFYSFFVQRKNNASSRKQTHRQGPKKTLEEHLMLYLLEHTDAQNPKDPQ